MTNCCRNSLNCSDEMLLILDGGKPICMNCAEKLGEMFANASKNRRAREMK